MVYRLTQLMAEKRAKVESLAQIPDEEFQKRGLTREAVAQLEMDAEPRLVWWFDPSYTQARQQFDPAFQEYPVVIVYCKTELDVKWGLQTAQSNNWKISCRSGGHSTAGYSVITDYLVIDMSGFDSVTVDAANKQATVGSGTQFGNLNSALAPYGLHVPGGECDNVCIAGFMQGGGYGFTSRRYGLNCDNVLAFRMMVNDKTGVHIVTASPTQNYDLYWAVRGGTGNNFGVLLDVTYQLYDLKGNLPGFRMKWDWRRREYWPDALLALQNNYAKKASSKLGIQGVIMVEQGDDDPSLQLSGMYVDGSMSEMMVAIQPLQAIGGPLTKLYSQPYKALTAAILPEPHVPDGWDPNKFPPELKQSAYIANPIDRAGWAKIADYFNTRPLHNGQPNPTNAVFFEYYGGAIKNPKYPNAFIHRDVYMDIYIDSFWFDEAPNSPEKQAAEKWLDGYIALLKQYSNGQEYQNYPRRGTQNYWLAYWGNAYPTLQTVKAKYDPYGFFNFPLGINAPSAADSQDKLLRKAKRAAKASAFPKARVVYDQHFERYLKRQRADEKQES